jgi:hypothetical protein
MSGSGMFLLPGHDRQTFDVVVNLLPARPWSSRAEGAHSLKNPEICLRPSGCGKQGRFSKNLGMEVGMQVGKRKVEPFLFR